MLHDFLVMYFFLPCIPPDRDCRTEILGSDFLDVVVLENSRVHLHGQAVLFSVPLFH
jgi:hypothetical protein